MSMKQATTFTMEVQFLSKVPDLENHGEFKDQIVQKTATFQELDRTNRDQTSLHATIISLCASINSQRAGKARLTKVDPDLLSEFVEFFVEDLLIPNTSFTEQDKVELLLDRPNLIILGLDLVKEKAYPFFASIRPTSTPSEANSRKRSRV